MNPSEIRDRIVTLLGERGAAPLSASEISAALQLKGKNAKHLQKWLHALALRGEIVCIRSNRYALGARADLVTGVLDVARSGNGFVEGTGESAGCTVFVPSDNLSTALPGDRVIVRIERTAAGAPAARESAARAGVAREGRLTGTIIRILERTRRDIVGTLRSTGRFLYVVPVDHAYRQDFYVPDAAGANLNDRVVIRFTGWPNRHVSPEAEVVEALGPADDPSVDTLTIVRHYGLHDAFPERVVREAEAASALMDHPGRREDLREQYVLTVDPARARDFDDALSLAADAAGNRVLGVHIADVCHFVKAGSALDRAAAARGNSVYFPDTVLPMLPEQLSNGVCSLRPDEDRLAFSAFLTVDAAGRVKARRFAKTIIRSRLRLTYEQAMSVLSRGRPPEGGPRVPPEGVRLIQAIGALAQQLRARRFARHALNLDVPESEVVIGPDGRIREIRTVANDESHQMIEECMVAANEAVAADLADRAVPSIARLHEPPNGDKIEELTAQLVGMGFQPGDLHERENLAAFLRSIEGEALAHAARVAVLRSMKRALYSATATGHYGLAKKFYAHFTSPIRRYPDLVVHRQLAAALARGDADARRRGHGGTPYGKSELAAIAEACSLTERTADEAERALLEIKKYRFLEAELAAGTPGVREAAIVAVMNFGLFVELLDLQLQGLVHISAISEAFVRYDRRRQTLAVGQQAFKVGGRVRVRVKAVDFDKRRIDFDLA